MKTLILLTVQRAKDDAPESMLINPTSIVEIWPVRKLTYQWGKGEKEYAAKSMVVRANDMPSLYVLQSAKEIYSDIMADPNAPRSWTTEQLKAERERWLSLA